MTGAVSFSASGAETFVPDGVPVASALSRTTHLGIGAHPDDLEIMACHGILECHGKSDRWFCGVTLSNGGGSSRAGAFAQKSDAEMIELRKEEQKRAARLGEYGAMVLLNHPSAAVKDARHEGVLRDLDQLFAATKPEVVYTHNLADKHDTHVATALRVIAAVRRLPREKRPHRVIGCEVWRDLDWLDDGDKVVMPVGGHGTLPAELIAVFESQIAGGKRYDLAAAGRRLAHATFFESHDVDRSQAVVLGMDLTPLVMDDAKDPASFAAEHVERLLRDVKARIAKMG
ncbi:MAG: PIG-L family deacetylase [Polyangiaceae bacterium]